MIPEGIFPWPAVKNGTDGAEGIMIVRRLRSNEGFSDEAGSL